MTADHKQIRHSI